MFKLASLVLVALSAVSVVNGAAVLPRTAVTPPPGWIPEILEVSVLFLLGNGPTPKCSPEI